MDRTCRIELHKIGRVWRGTNPSLSIVHQPRGHKEIESSIRENNKNKVQNTHVHEFNVHRIIENPFVTLLHINSFLAIIDWIFSHYRARRL